MLNVTQKGGKRPPETPSKTPSKTPQPRKK